MKSFPLIAALGELLAMDPKHPHPQDKSNAEMSKLIPQPKPRTFAFFEVRRIAGPNGFVYNVWFVVRREYQRKPLEQKKVGGQFKTVESAEAFRAACRVTKADETVTK